MPAADQRLLTIHLNLGIYLLMQKKVKTKALRNQILKLVEEYDAIALASYLFLPGATIIPLRAHRPTWLRSAH